MAMVLPTEDSCDAGNAIAQGSGRCSGFRQDFALISGNAPEARTAVHAPDGAFAGRLVLK
ncbi:MAG TPA: hypothetical protein VH278_00855 [Burkholderiaceae bacterium]|jgi:hypothetical protein|nr:hypothetical protein [Burkholderiaceae bacterium]